jgi:hypothetical protein
MFARRGERRLFAEIDERLAPVRELDRHESAATEVAGGGIHHRERIPHGDCRIDGVAAALQYVDADLGRELMRGNHHAMLARDRCRGCRMRATEGNDCDDGA